MTTDYKPGTSRSARGRWALRVGAALPAVVMLLGVLFLLVDLEKEQPDFYQPARAELTEAATILSQTYAEEKELFQQLRPVHTRLDDAIALLGRAERLDPEDKRRIETLQARLRALEDTDRMLSTDPKDLLRAYRELTDQLNDLAMKLEQSKA
jgi:predicted  nucleic acid-binding Zn-ribbon protein